MYVADKLSSEMGINYQDLFQKLRDFYSMGNSPREDLRLNIVFTEQERDFLSVIALEYLKDQLDKGLDAPVLPSHTDGLQPVDPFERDIREHGKCPHRNYHIS